MISSVKYAGCLLAIAFLVSFTGATSAAAQGFTQSPNDWGEADSLGFVFGKLPDFDSYDSTLRLDLYAYHDTGMLMAVGAGLWWTGNDARLDSASLSPLVDSLLSVANILYYNDDIDASNLRNWFSCVAVYGGGDSFYGDTARFRLASYYFTLRDWSVGDTLKFDTLRFNAGTKLTLAIRDATVLAYAPYWKGPAIYTDSVCCVNRRGNVDCSPDDVVSSGDLTALIDALFGSLNPPCCLEEADMDYDGDIDLGDLSVLIDHLYNSLNPLKYCQ